MHTQAQSQSTNRRQHEPSLPIYANEGLSPKKTFLVIITVVGCIAILWPKVFYPMMFASTPTAGKSNIKGGAGGIRQERSSHLHPDSVYEAMRERGRAIPATPTIPIVERKSSPSNPPPRIVEGRPGPIPGMRPPMGAGSIHQPQARQGTMGLIMPVYTIGIIIFFGYTIMKIVMKKQAVNAPYGAAPGDPNFRKEVFGKGNGRHVEDLNGSKLVVTAIQGLIDAADEELKLRETSTTDPSKVNSNENSTTTNQQQPQQSNISNGHADINEKSGDVNSRVDDLKATDDKRKKREGSTDRTVSVLGMEITASCEGGHKWSGRPPTPVLLSHHEHSKHDEDDVMPEPQEIYLEGSLAHDSQILVAESETKQEKVYDAELNGSPEEPAVILSSKMTLSLINLDNILDKKSPTKQPDLESPLADDIEIIGHDEH
ncbi:uncharacterized protein RIC-3 isoform X7 [Calliphora vicina]|uniref:uncharacterized protein RIC-3 isoform X7 n=1 Tax=Calliphora vicina TaxID=7373 RepID=UPI00325B90C4